MNTFIGHITAGIAGSTIASVVLESGNIVAAGSLIALCLCFVGAKLAQEHNGSGL